MEAHNLYLKGRYFWNQRTREGLEKGIEYFEEAIARDQHFALAYTGLADCHTFLVVYGGSGASEIKPKAEAAARKALSLDETLAEAHVSLGMIRILEFDWPAAEREFKRAVELNPGLAKTHHLYAMVSMVLGRLDEAIEEIQRAVELDPLGITTNQDAGRILYCARRYDEAVEQFNEALEINPQFKLARMFLGLAYVQKEMYEEALEESSPGSAFFGATQAFMGRPEQAHDILEDLKRAKRANFTGQAILYLALNQNEQAIHCLERAYQGRELLLLQMVVAVETLFDPLRSDPKFTDLLRKMQLPG